MGLGLGLCFGLLDCLYQSLDRVLYTQIACIVTGSFYGTGISYNWARSMSYDAEYFLSTLFGRGF
jgi:hypothetical protein